MLPYNIDMFLPLRPSLGVCVMGMPGTLNISIDLTVSASSCRMTTKFGCMLAKGRYFCSCIRWLLCTCSGMHTTCHLDRGLKLMKACEIVWLASQHLDSSDLFLLNHGKLPLSLAHQVLYQLIVLFVYLTVPLELCSSKTRNWVCLQTFASSGAQHSAIQRQHLPLQP